MGRHWLLAAACYKCPFRRESALAIEQPKPRGSFRRTRWAAVGAFGALAATFALGGQSAASPAQTADLKPGVGLAIAETEKLDPRAGGLSLGITAGRSIAGHQNTVAQASSQALDYGVIGSTLAAEGCDGSKPTLPSDQQPHAIHVDSRQANSTQDADEDKVPVPAHKHASANPTPYGEAVTTTGPLGVPGILSIGGGVATTHSGLVEDGAAREAKAITDIASITFPLGSVTLSGLHWEATSNTSGLQGIFSIGSATIAGQSIPTNDPTAALAQINTVLEPLGVKIAPPTTRIIDAIQPARQDLFDALLEQDCGNATYITVFDIAVGSITGAGSFSLVLGGVQASSGESLVNPFNLGAHPSTFPGLSLPGTPATPASAGTSVASSALTPSAPTVADAAANPAALTQKTTPASSIKDEGKRGGALAGVGLAGLGALAVVAEGDRRKMRRAQKEIPQFEE